MTMTTYCTICKVLIPEKRAARGSHFCSEVCHEHYRRERRDWRALRACRLCGRPARPRRKETKLDHVPTAHNVSERLMDGEI